MIFSSYTVFLHTLKLCHKILLKMVRGTAQTPAEVRSCRDPGSEAEEARPNVRGKRSSSPHHPAHTNLQSPAELMLKTTIFTKRAIQKNHPSTRKGWFLVFILEVTFGNVNSVHGTL